MSKVTLEDIHECLIGNKLAGQKGIISTIDDIVDCQDKMNDKVCIMQNQLGTLMQDREKGKGKVTVTVPKWICTIIGLKVKSVI